MRRFALLSLLLPSLVWGASGTFSANGNSDEVTCQTGTGRVAAEGNFGSGTAALQWFLVDTWQQVSTDASWTADSGAVPFDVGGPAQLRINLSGSTSPDLDWDLVCDGDQ